MKTSANGLKFLESEEGVRLKVYKDSAGLPTIGVGHLLTKAELTGGFIKIGGKFVPYRDGLTRPQVDALLAQDLGNAESDIARLVKVPLSQSQFDALVSFTFNCGEGALQSSSLLKRLNQGQYYAVPEELPKWCHSGGKVDKVLVGRRDRETKLWRGQI